MTAPGARIGGVIAAVERRSQLVSDAGAPSPEVQRPRSPRSPTAPSCCAARARRASRPGRSSTGSTWPAACRSSSRRPEGCAVSPTPSTGPAPRSPRPSRACTGSSGTVRSRRRGTGWLGSGTCCGRSTSIGPGRGRRRRHEGCLPPWARCATTPGSKRVPCGLSSAAAKRSVGRHLDHGELGQHAGQPTHEQIPADALVRPGRPCRPGHPHRDEQR